MYDVAKQPLMIKTSLLNNAGIIRLIKMCQIKLPFSVLYLNKINIIFFIKPRKMFRVVYTITHPQLDKNENECPIQFLSAITYFVLFMHKLFIPI
jgi:hypothetical protein